MNEKEYYMYDPNKRVYMDKETGKKSISPIRKYSYEKIYFVGETIKSYLFLPYHSKDMDQNSELFKIRVIKIPKNKYDGKSFKNQNILTLNEMNDEIWFHERKYQIIDKLKFSSNVQLFKLIEQELEKGESK